MTDAAAVALVIWLTYLLIGIFFGKRWYAQRHGVTARFFFTLDTFNPARFAIIGVAIVWPLTFFVPFFQSPPECRHVEHIRARQLVEQRYRGLG